jgi:hypothetical protein
MPEITLRSLTLEEKNHARVIFIHHNVPGVLKRVNEILGDHNVDKQITDNKGDVRKFRSYSLNYILTIIGCIPDGRY